MHRSNAVTIKVVEKIKILNFMVFSKLKFLKKIKEGKQVGFRGELLIFKIRTQ